MAKGAAPNEAAPEPDERKVEPGGERLWRLRKDFGTARAEFRPDGTAFGIPRERSWRNGESVSTTTTASGITAVRLAHHEAPFQHHEGLSQLDGDLLSIATASVEMSGVPFSLSGERSASSKTYFFVMLAGVLLTSRLVFVRLERTLVMQRWA